MATLRPVARREGPRRACHFIEMINDGVGVDQRLTRFQNEGGHTQQRIDLLHLRRIAENGKGLRVKGMW